MKCDRRWWNDGRLASECSSHAFPYTEEQLWWMHFCAAWHRIGMAVMFRLQMGGALRAPQSKAEVR